MKPQGPITERVQTDQSLRQERRNADQAVQNQQTAAKVADRLVDRARSAADAVLDRARDRADGQADPPTGDRPGAGTAATSPPQATRRERADADRLLTDERAAEDAAMRRQREAQTSSAESQLLRERSNTDRYLLTERGRADDAIAHRDDFLGMVSHDLRNLLHSVNLNAIHLSEKASASEEGQRTVDGMRRLQADVARMDHIIQDLIDVVSIEAGRLRIRPLPGDAAILLREAADAFAIRAAQKNIALTVQPPTQALEACFDHLRMAQVLANCVSNAIKFTPDGGRVDLSGAQVGDEVRLSVRDTGPGIPAALQEAVFERFWQIGSNDQRGLGLGLYISRCIVTGHHGRIWFDRDAAPGSTVHCTLPREPLAGRS